MTEIDLATPFGVEAALALFPDGHKFATLKKKTFVPLMNQPNIGTNVQYPIWIRRTFVPKRLLQNPSIRDEDSILRIRTSKMYRVVEVDQLAVTLLPQGCLENQDSNQRVRVEFPELTKTRTEFYKEGGQWGILLWLGYFGNGLDLTEAIKNFLNKDDGALDKTPKLAQAA